MGLIGALIMGAIAGWGASKIMGTSKEQPLWMDILLGIAGGFVGGIIGGFLGLGGAGVIIQLILAIIGAVLLLFAKSKLMG